MAANAEVQADPEPAAHGLEHLRVTIAHDWLVRFAGSERVVDQMLALFPQARLLTTIVDRDALQGPLRDAVPSFLQRVPFSTRRHEWLLPLMPLAWRLHHAHAADVVISSSHACAKAVPLPPDTPHICYCHTPMRYAWDFRAEQGRFPRSVRPAASTLMTGFRYWDRRTSRGVTRFVANSSAVAERIRRFYDRGATIVHPPVRTDFFSPGGMRDDFFLYVGRLTGYKRPDLVVDAFRDLPHRLMVVGEGPMDPYLRQRATSNVEFCGAVDDGVLRDLYRSARALVFPADEDFGIAMAEAQACGTPVIGLARGGALDIVRNGQTGWLIKDQTVDAVRIAIRQVVAVDLDPQQIAASASRFSARRFRDEIRAVVEEVLAARAPARVPAPAPA